MINVQSLLLSLLPHSKVHTGISDYNPAHVMLESSLADEAFVVNIYGSKDSRELCDIHFSFSYQDPAGNKQLYQKLLPYQASKMAGLLREIYVMAEREVNSKYPDCPEPDRLATLQEDIEVLLRQGESKYFKVLRDNMDYNKTLQLESKEDGSKAFLSVYKQYLSDNLAGYTRLHYNNFEDARGGEIVKTEFCIFISNLDVAQYDLLRMKHYRYQTEESTVQNILQDLRQHSPIIEQIYLDNVLPTAPGSSRRKKI